MVHVGLSSHAVSQQTGPCLLPDKTRTHSCPRTPTLTRPHVYTRTPRRNDRGRLRHGACSHQNGVAPAGSRQLCFMEGAELLAEDGTFVEVSGLRRGDRLRSFYGLESEELTSGGASVKRVRGLKQSDQKERKNATEGLPHDLPMACLLPTHGPRATSPRPAPPLSDGGGLPLPLSMPMPCP